MSVEDNKLLASQLDFGDGVPALVLLEDSTAGSEVEPAPNSLHISGKAFAIVAAIVGQLLIALAVAAGGSPLIGIFSAIVLLVFSLALLLAASAGS